MSHRILPLFGVAALALSAVGPAHAIGAIDSSAPYCRKLKGNRCVINWQYVSVGASPNYMIDLTVFLDDKLVLKASGFFQTSLYLDNSFFGEGIPVQCGNPGATPVPNPPPAYPLSYGSSYSWAIRARDSADLNTANYGTVICPPR